MIMPTWPTEQTQAWGVLCAPLKAKLGLVWLFGCFGNHTAQVDGILTWAGLVV